MLTTVEFRSDRFPAYEGEEEQINPGLWGQRLAELLRDKLLAEGFKTREPVAEDSGWRVDVENEDFDLWIGCGRYQEYADGFLCFIEPHTPHVRKLLGKVDVRERVALLQRSLNEILVDAQVLAIRWWTHGEFNNPKG